MVRKKKKQKEADFLPSFEQHGFEAAGSSGDNVYGDCVFCGGENKFYLSPVTGQWDCKTCSRKPKNGNLSTFLRKRWTFLNLKRNRPKQVDWKRLSKLRLMSTRMLKQADIAYDGALDTWVFPYYNTNGDVVGLARWKEPSTSKQKRKLMTTSNTSKYLYGLKALLSAEKGATVYICEGEWDAIALEWLLDAVQPDGSWVVIGVPGAGSFSTKFLQHFVEGDFDYRICFDNDDAGRSGAEDVASPRKLGGLPGTAIQQVIWNRDDPNDKFDVREYIKGQLALGETAEEIFEGLELQFEDVEIAPEASTMELDALTMARLENANKVEVGSIPETKILNLERTLAVLEKSGIGITEAFHEAFVLSAALAFGSADNLRTEKPLWVQIMGKPGCGKSTVIDLFQKSARCFSVKSMTPQSLASGMPETGGGDPSLLPQMNKHLVLISDFAEMLKGSQMEGVGIFEILRPSYDGEYEKIFGNGLKRVYRDLYFNMLTGVTHEIQNLKNVNLGERFLTYHYMEAEDITEQRTFNKLMKRRRGEETRELKQKRLDAVANFLSRELEAEDVPVFGEDVIRRLMDLALLCAVLRAERLDVKFGSVQHSDIKSESPARLAEQLTSMAELLCLVEGSSEPTALTWKIISNMAFTSAKEYPVRILNCLYNAKEPVDRLEIHEATKVNRHSISEYLLRFEEMKLVEKKVFKGRTNSIGRPSASFSLTKQWKEKVQVVEFWKSVKRKK